MAGKQKLKKFAELTSFPNVLEAFTYDDGYLHANAIEKVLMTGSWASQFFKNDHPLTLELGCGKGEYSTGLAKLYPSQNFIGVDIKGNRLWTGAYYAIDNEIDNVGFLRSKIEFIDSYFEEDEVSGIWIIFPDPFLKSRDMNRRLTSQPFLDKYCKILRNGSHLHLKTDSEELYDFTLKSIAQHENFRVVVENSDIDRSPRSDELAIKTFYEKQHIRDGKKIRYIRCEMEK